MTAHNVVLVTGATGNVGPHVVAQLAAAGVPVRALVLEGDPGADDLPDGVEVVHGDLADPGSVEARLDGVDAVLLMWPFFTLNVDTTPAVLDAIARHASRIVFVSSIGVHLGLEMRTNNCHAFVEGLIRETKLDWTFLQTVGFAANTLGWAQQIRTDGVVRAPYGAASRSPVHEADLAAVAVQALTGEGHAGKSYVVTGPEALPQSRQVAVIGEVIDRPLLWEEMPPETAREHMLASRWPASYADGALEYFAMLVTEPELVTSTVKEVTGKAARTYREWVTEHADDFRRAAPEDRRKAGLSHRSPATDLG